MVDKHALIIMHVDASLRTTTLYVPKVEDVDNVHIKETLKDITVLMKCLLNEISYAECIVKKACMINENFDIPLHKSN